MPARATAMMLSDLDERTIGALLAAAGPGVDSPLLSVEVRDYRRGSTGANASRLSAGAYDGLALFAIGVPINPQVAAALDVALDGLREAMRPSTEERVLLNLLGDGDLGPDRTRASFAAEEF